HPVGFPDVDVKDDDPAWLNCKKTSILLKKYISTTSSDGPWSDAQDAANALEAIAEADAWYEIRVSNTGDADLTGVEVSDAKLGISNFPIPDASMVVGGSYVIGKGSPVEGALYKPKLCKETGYIDNEADVLGHPVGFPDVDVKDDDPAWLYCKSDPCELTLELECAVPAPPTGQECTNRPIQIVFEYTQTDCDATTNWQYERENGRVICNDRNPLLLNDDVVIRYVGNDSGLIVMDHVGGNLYALATDPVGGKLQSQSPFVIEDTFGATLQEISLHTSCSKPLAVDDQFGALKVVEITEQDGTVIGGVPAEPAWHTDLCSVYSDQTECKKRSTALGFRFNAGDCSQSANSQDSGKFECNDIVAPVGPGPYTLEFDSGGGVYWTDLVNPGDEFEVLALDDGRSDFASQTDWALYEGTTLLQVGTFHTSCSQNLFIGDFYGNLEVISFTNSEQGFVTANNAIDLRYTVKNTGTPDIDRICVGDDNATPGDVSDDVLVTPPDCDTIPDASDPLAKDQSRMYYRLGVPFTGDNPIFTAYAEGRNAQVDGEVCKATDPVEILVETRPTPIASCDTGKPQGLVFAYTGGDCSASTNEQEGKAKCEPSLGPGPVAGLPVEVTYRGKGKKHVTLWPEGEVVNKDDLVTLEASGKGKKGKKLESNTKLEIKQGGNTVQKLEIHTSCSKPLNVGDVFGSLTLMEFIPYQK
ncbi:hypothetical protein ACFL3I_12805, partial [Pseudomonadota bacterium]